METACEQSRGEASIIYLCIRYQLIKMIEVLVITCFCFKEGRVTLFRTGIVVAICCGYFFHIFLSSAVILFMVFESTRSCFSNWLFWLWRFSHTERNSPCRTNGTDIVGKYMGVARIILHRPIILIIVSIL